jgi:hypothetical protein
MELSNGLMYAQILRKSSVRVRRPDEPCLRATQLLHLNFSRAIPKLFCYTTLYSKATFASPTYC